MRRPPARWGAGLGLALALAGWALAQAPAGPQAGTPAGTPEPPPSRPPAASPAAPGGSLPPSPAAAVAGSRCLAQAPSRPGTATASPVQRVVDGDTFVAGAGTASVRVRLIGIDAPESVAPDQPVEPGGRAAARFLRELLAGRTVWLVPGRNPEDAYGRALRWAWLADGRFLNGELVRLGYARVYTFPDNPDYAAHLRLCEREAKAAGRGIWQASREQDD